MEFDKYIRRKEDLYWALLNFIDATDNIDDEFQNFVNVFEHTSIFQTKSEILSIFRIISNIVDNHHRNSEFYNNLRKFFNYFIQYKETLISDSEIYQIYDNKLVLLLLLEINFIKPTDAILRKMNKSNLYFYSGVKQYISKEQQKRIENLILQNYADSIEKFESKCHNGENDSKICTMIRQDLVKDFIAYINRSNISVRSTIKSSFYETNKFLIGKTPTLIEYATFFGSLQIIRYLNFNMNQIPSTMWMYAIHSNNAELIHFLEENKVDVKILKKRWPFDHECMQSFEILLKESIKCHHNDIANYIKDTYLKKK